MQIVFNGQQYKVSALAALTGFGHKETLNTNDLNVVQGSHYDCKYPVVYKHDGKAYVLAGKIDWANEKTLVVIISKHILKKGLMSVQTQPINIGVDHLKNNRGSSPPQRFMGEKQFKPIKTIKESDRNSGSVKNTENHDKTKHALSILQKTMLRIID